MIESLNQLDIHLFEILNGLHSAWLDPIMAFLSHKLSWVPAYIFLLIIIYRRDGWQKTLLLLVSIGLLITLTDQTSSTLLKPNIERYRPCRTEAQLSFDVHTVNNKCGGKYGFVSSHASNFFGLAVFLSLYFRRRKVSYLLLGIAMLVAYTRVYLGVHYPGDVLVGAAIGSLFGLIVFWVYQKALDHPYFSTHKPTGISRGS